MNRNWTIVFIAGLFEVGWVAGLKHASTALEWAGTAVAIFFSFYLLILSAKRLPVGTVYAVFAGIGTGGTVLTEIIVFDEPVNVLKLVLIGVLLCGVIGLKLITKESGEDGTREAALDSQQENSLREKNQASLSTNETNVSSAPESEKDPSTDVSSDPLLVGRGTAINETEQPIDKADAGATAEKLERKEPVKGGRS